LFTRSQTRFQHTHRERPRAYVVAVVCLALLALLTFAQVTHTHPANTDADHCPLCIVMHSASPVAATAALITLVQIAVAAPVFKVRGISRVWHAQLFTRPPPAGC
jgi:TRAP-type C4-dicarboxylate transport system permease small subunit